MESRVLYLSVTYVAVLDASPACLYKAAWVQRCVCGSSRTWPGRHFVAVDNGARRQPVSGGLRWHTQRDYALVKKMGPGVRKVRR